MNDDQALMRRLQQGDESAFEQIVRQWEQPMLNFFYRSVGDLDAAEDLRQDLFVRLYTYRASYRGNGTFRSWLYQLATNLLRTHFRRVRSVLVASLSDDGDDEPSDADDKSGAGWQPANGTAAGQAVLRAETERLVRGMLDALSPEDREALILRFYEGLPYHEICAALGIAESSAKSRVYRAIEKMREIVAARGLKAEEVF